MPPPDAGDLIAAIATPSGRGGIGIVRLSGASVSRVIEAIVGRDLTPRVATRADFLSAGGEIIDQGLALYFPAPASYTGETVLELHGHGGPAVLSQVLRRCLELGARLAEPGEFTKRAFLNGKLDLAQAEGVADLIDAATATAARAAARSLSGEFSAEITAIVEELTELRAFTEATLDFPDEDIEFIRATDARGKLSNLRRRLSSILARARQGSLLREGLNVALIGRPNVGKSSLLNRLAGDDVAIVTPHPGTTRDALREAIEVHGVPLRVIDTAGLRDTADQVERIGIERTWATIGRADMVLIVTDARTPEHQDDAAIAARLPAALRRIVVRNKIDLAGVDPRRNDTGAMREVWLSAKTGDGFELLRQAMLEAAGAHEDMEDAFLARERHLAAMRTAEARLEAAAAQLEGSPPPLEFFAEELRAAQQALSTITGEFTADDLLGAIFGRFCIGK
ncbi:MAG TPA: tRNA uridine-5-carboxymethylaminomethyl(34) synthesis GTPase MnmE [Casimicrobiaceae bacterium]|nr:tRNA uridine-5-carboxymethylaminomethyl(34) synthesis GTPase MnmE [Casimicrobiaceae bacterium]